MASGSLARSSYLAPFWAANFQVKSFLVLPHFLLFDFMFWFSYPQLFVSHSNTNQKTGSISRKASDPPSFPFVFTSAAAAAAAANLMAKRKRESEGGFHRL